MKKLWLGIILAWLLLLISIAAGASGVYVITVMDTDISVAMPDGYDTLTRELDLYEGILEKYGIDRGTLQNTMRAESRYLEAMNRSTGNEIMIKSYMDKNSINLWSFSLKKPSEIARYSESVEKLMGEGIEVEYFKTDSGYQFMRYRHGTDGMDALVYVTIENGRYVEIAAYGYHDGDLRPEDATALLSVVQSFTVRNFFLSQDAWDSTDTQNLVTALLLVGLIAAGVTVVRFSRSTKQEKWRAQQERDRLPTREELIAQGVLRRRPADFSPDSAARIGQPDFFGVPDPAEENTEESEHADETGSYKKDK